MLFIKPFGLFIIALSIIFPVFWLKSLIGKYDDLALFSQYLGMGALIAMAWGQLIATRIKLVELVFGGLDRGYILHKWLGIFAILAILLHDTIDADMRRLGVETLLSDIAETFGEMSLYGLLVLVVISIATFIPYHLWCWTHKFMGLFFMLGAFHFLFILKPFKNADPLGLYVTAFCLLGIVAFLYRLAPSGFRPAKKYKVEKISLEAGSTCLTLLPKNKALRHRAGQFAFLQFPESVSKEPHPFTISSAPNKAGLLRFTIADLGDFTGRDLQRLKEEDEIRVEGPFGHFLRKGKRDEIWIAGGIGVTPFASWAGEFSAKSSEQFVTFYYCVKDKARAAHLGELEKCAKSNDNFKFIIVESEQGARLSTDMIAQNHGQDLSKLDFYFCGPEGLGKSLKQGLSQHGVGPRQFHYEEFEIRSGIGLKRLAFYILGRLLPRSN